MAKSMKDIFNEIKAGAKAQHEVDAMNFAATKAEGKASWEEAKVFSKVLDMQRKEEHRQQMEDAKARTEEAQKRIDAARALRAKTTA